MKSSFTSTLACSNSPASVATCGSCWRTNRPRPLWRSSISFIKSSSSSVPTRPSSAGSMQSSSRPELAERGAGSRCHLRQARLARRKIGRGGQFAEWTVHFNRQQHRVGLCHSNQRGADDRSAYAGDQQGAGIHSVSPLAMTNSDNGDDNGGKIFTSRKPQIRA